jgi:hypothetical protein
MAKWSKGRKTELERDAIEQENAKGRQSSK